MINTKTIYIYSNATKAKTIEVQAEVYSDIWAIHQTPMQGSVWFLTHVPTGTYVCDTTFLVQGTTKSTQKTLVKLIKRLLTTNLDMTFTDFKVAPEETLDELRKAITLYSQGLLP